MKLENQMFHSESALGGPSESCQAVQSTEIAFLSGHWQSVAFAVILAEAQL